LKRTFQLLLERNGNSLSVDNFGSFVALRVGALESGPGWNNILSLIL